MMKYINPTYICMDISGKVRNAQMVGTVSVDLPEWGEVRGRGGTGMDGS